MSSAVGELILFGTFEAATPVAFRESGVIAARDSERGQAESPRLCPEVKPGGARRTLAIDEFGKGMKLKILWLGADTHAPGEGHPWRINHGVPWHYAASGRSFFRYLDDHHDLTSVDKPAALDATPNGGLKLGRTELAPLDGYHLIIFSWNYFRLHPSEYRSLCEIEDLARQRTPALPMLNPPSRLPYLHSKHELFELLGGTPGLRGCMPRHVLLRHPNDVDTLGRAGWPVIIKADNGAGGKSTHLAGSVQEALQAIRTLQWERRSLQIRYTFNKKRRARIPTRFIGVEFFDTYDKGLGQFTTFRALFLGDRLCFCYPHVSTDNWCSHTDMKDSSPGRKGYMAAAERAAFEAKRFYNELNRARHAAGVDFAAIDFLVANDELKILEIELKYGLDRNFFRGQKQRYNLDDQHFAKMLATADIPPFTEETWESFLQERAESSTEGVG